MWPSDKDDWRPANSFSARVIRAWEYVQSSHIKIESNLPKVILKLIKCIYKQGPGLLRNHDNQFSRNS